MAARPTNQVQTSLRTDLQLLDLGEVCSLTGLSRATIYRLMHAGDFPAGTRISPNRIAWRETSIARWLASR